MLKTPDNCFGCSRTSVLRLIIARSSASRARNHASLAKTFPAVILLRSTCELVASLRGTNAFFGSCFTRDLELQNDFRDIISFLLYATNEIE